MLLPAYAPCASSVRVSRVVARVSSGDTLYMAANARPTTFVLRRCRIHHEDIANAIEVDDANGHYWNKRCRTVV
jgi:hypothetical protein